MVSVTSANINTSANTNDKIFSQKSTTNTNDLKQKSIGSDNELEKSNKKVENDSEKQSQQPINDSNTTLDCFDVGCRFVEQYYSFLSDEKINLMHKFYAGNSHVIMGHYNNELGDTSKTLIGQKEINDEYDKMYSINNSDLRNPFTVEVKHLDALPTLNNGILLNVTGIITVETPKNEKTVTENMIEFTQVFVLAEQPNGFYILNDILKYNKDPSELIVKREIEKEIETITQRNNDEKQQPENTSTIVETSDFQPASTIDNDKSLENDFKPRENNNITNQKTNDFGDISIENKNLSEKNKTASSNTDKETTQRDENNPHTEDLPTSSWANLAKKNVNKWGGLKSDVVQGTTTIPTTTITGSAGAPSSKKDNSHRNKSTYGSTSNNKEGSSNSDRERQNSVKDTTNNIFIKNIEKDILNSEAIKKILQDQLGSQSSVVDVKVIYSKNSAVAQLENQEYVTKILQEREIKSADRKHTINCYVFRPPNFSDNNRGGHSRNNSEYKRGSGNSSRNSTNYGHRRSNSNFVRSQGQGNKKSTGNDQTNQQQQ